MSEKRTTYNMGTETDPEVISGAKCTTCGMTYKACSGRVLKGRGACCGDCFEEDTHDTRPARIGKTVRAAYAAKNGKSGDTQPVAVKASEMQDLLNGLAAIELEAEISGTLITAKIRLHSGIEATYRNGDWTLRS